MITGLIIYATGEVEIVKYNVNNIFKFYNSQLYINGLCFIYCEHMDTYNYMANYLINTLNNTTNIVNNICGNVYVLKIDENNNIVNFNQEQIEEIMQSIGS